MRVRRLIDDGARMIDTRLHDAAGCLTDQDHLCHLLRRPTLNHDELLDYYREPGIFTTVGGFEDQVDALPDDVGKIAHAVQMLLVHRAWAPHYGLEVTPERELENGLHSTEAMLTMAMQHAPTPIGGIRLPQQRVVGVCRHFSTMMAAFLKQKGVPARARCGFATYFEQGKYVDHWVCEYWLASESRWVQVDAQLDTLQQQVVKVDFDPLDTPRDRFLTAGDVWRQYRAGTIDPETCGIMHMWGAWYIAGNLALDVASLQRIELLPWEPVGLLGITGEPPASEEAADAASLLYDDVAALTVRADAAAITELLAMADRDARLRPPVETIARAQAADASGVGTGANPLASA